MTMTMILMLGDVSVGGRAGCEGEAYVVRESRIGS